MKSSRPTVEQRDDARHREERRAIWGDLMRLSQAVHRLATRLRAADPDLDHQLWSERVNMPDSDR